jgi:Silicon transporter
LSTKLVHSGEYLNRYLLGRPFMVVLSVFSVNMAAGPNKGANIWDFPDLIVDIFLGSGLAMILITWLASQLNRTSHPAQDFKLHSSGLDASCP